MYFIRANYDNDDDEKFSSPKFGHRTKLQTVIFDTVDVRGVPKNLEVGVPSPLVAGHNRPKSISLSQMCYCARWVSVPEGVNFKLCVLVYRSLHGLGPKYFFRGLQARVRDSLSPETVFSLEYRRRGSCHTPVFTWRPRIFGRRSSGMERVTVQCHLRAVSVHFGDF